MSELLSPPDSAKAALSAAVSDAGSQAKLNAHSGDPLWWRWGFALLSLILCAAAPLTAAVHGSYARSREIEIARQTKQMELEIAQRKEDYALRLQFLDRAVDPKYPAQLRLKTFGSFLAALATSWKLQRNLGGQAATPRSPCRPDNSVLCWSSCEHHGPAHARLRGRRALVRHVRNTSRRVSGQRKRHAERWCVSVRQSASG